MATPMSKWMRGDYFLLDTVDYRPDTDRVRVRFRNADQIEVSTAELWRNRPGLPDWRQVRIDLETDGALLVPTLPGHSTIEGDVAEIPGDVIRAATDADYRAYVEALKGRTA